MSYRAQSTKIIMRLLFAVLFCSFPGMAHADSMGVEIVPDDNGRFEFVEDFNEFEPLDVFFTENLPYTCWEKGSFTNRGPNRRRSLICRFYGANEITGVKAVIDQTANIKNYGSLNLLYVSKNGLDWVLVDSSKEQSRGPSGWQSIPLVLPKHKTDLVTGTNEFWIKVVMDNVSGVKTNISNTIKKLSVKIKVKEPSVHYDEQAEMLKKWGESRKKNLWKNTITLDSSDPLGNRPLHYYEDYDGWLFKVAENPNFKIDESESFQLKRAYSRQFRTPLSLALFFESDRSNRAVLAQIVVDSDKHSSRKMEVLFDGIQLETFDIADYFEDEKVFVVELPCDGKTKNHKLQISAGDDGVIRIKRVSLIGKKVEFVEKPKLKNNNKVKIQSSYYIPDSMPPKESQTVEGAIKSPFGVCFEKVQKIYSLHKEFGGIKIVVQNEGDSIVRIKDVLLNDRNIEEYYVDFKNSDWCESGVVWYRVRPKTIEPGKCSQIYVRFRRKLDGDSVKVTVDFENSKSLTAKIPYKDASTAIEYVTTDRTMQKLYVYASNQKGIDGIKIDEILLDGKAIGNVDLYDVDFSCGMMMGVAKLSEPLTIGDYHVVSAVTNSGEVIGSEFRVLPYFFPRSSIHVPPALCKSMHMNMSMWYAKPKEVCDKYGIYSTVPYGRNFLDSHSKVAYVLGPDEPDAHDNVGGGHDRGLGFNGRRLINSGWHELVERFSKQATSWIIMNGTVRPLNWFTYGQFSDVCSSDPYPVTYYNADHSFVRECLGMTRLAGRPNRMYAVLETYGWTTGGAQGLPRGSRGPLPQEYCQNVVQAIGMGMKGLTSWTYASIAGGWQLNRDFAQEITRMNMLIENIEDELLLGVPVDLATTDAGLVATGPVGNEHGMKDRVWVGSVLCGPDSIILALANHIPAARPEIPKIEAASNVTVTVNLPEFIQKVKLFEVTENGFSEVGFENKGGVLKFKLDSIKSGRVFILRRD